MFPTSPAIALYYADPHGVADQRSRAVPVLRYKSSRLPQVLEVHRKPPRSDFGVPRRHFTPATVRRRSFSQHQPLLNKVATMAKLDLPAVWRDIKLYRRAYLLTVVASFGGMVRAFVRICLFITD